MFLCGSLLVMSLLMESISLSGGHSNRAKQNGQDYHTWNMIAILVVDSGEDVADTYNVMP